MFDAVEAAYRLHTCGNTFNPDSYFLRYPERPSARIIALPAHLGSTKFKERGVKWISSFPENRVSNLARASAVLILNDARPDIPWPVLEASLISATRTAASAAWRQSIFTNPFEGTLGVVGTGVIARTTVEWLLFRNWKFHKISLYDVDRKEAERFGKWLRDQHNLKADIQDRLEGAISDCSLILFTTTALAPYLSDEKLLKHCPTVLHLSLRDICVNVHSCVAKHCR